jgi:Uma2 family endonuclease
LALPEDTRIEIVDGVLRPMTRASKFNREVQFNLCRLLREQRPAGLRVLTEEVIVLNSDLPTARIPDVVVFNPDNDPEGRTNNTRGADVLLCVEVVSPTTQTADRYEKPGEYARGGFASYWRIELEPEPTVHVHTLDNHVYRETGRFTAGQVATDPVLDWIEIAVQDLLGDYAR